MRRSRAHVQDQNAATRAGQTKSNTTYDEKAQSGEAAPEHATSAQQEMPEPPKYKADEMER